jgi:hypothetical protein
LRTTFVAIPYSQGNAFSGSRSVRRNLHASRKTIETRSSAVAQSPTRRKQ